MKTKNIARIAGLAVVVVATGILLVRAFAGAPADTEPVQTTPDTSETADTSASPAASFPVPQPLSPEDAERANEVLTGEQAGEPTVTEDENGDVTIVPDWGAKAAASKPVTGEATTNIGGSGGGSMDLEDGVYQGDHPDEASPSTPAAPSTPAPKDAQPAEPAPQTPSTPSTDSSTGGPPTRDGTHNGEISADGKYMWGVGFGWVEIGSGSYSVPGSSAGGTELSGIKVGDM